MQLLAFLLLSFLPGAALPSHSTYAAEKIINITVSATGNVSIDGVAIEADVVTKELQQRLWRSYMVSGKMADRIHIQWNEANSEALKKSISDAIKEAQSKTLTMLCLHKYKKKFEDIGSRKQDRLQKQYPALFQQTYT